MPDDSAAQRAASGASKTGSKRRWPRFGGNQSKAAKLLGVSRRTLVSRIVEYAIRRPRDE